MDSKTFVVHIAIQEQEEILVHLDKKAQIRALIFDEALTVILTKFSDYNYIFLMENAVELVEYSKINDHTIKQKKVSSHFLSLFTA